MAALSVASSCAVQGRVSALQFRAAASSRRIVHLDQNRPSGLRLFTALEFTPWLERSCQLQGAARPSAVVCRRCKRLQKRRRLGLGLGLGLEVGVRLASSPVCAVRGGDIPPGGSSGGDWRKDPLLDSWCPVPKEQQPMNEYQNLLEMGLFSWVTLGPVNYALRLAAIGVCFSLLIGWPVSSLTFNPRNQALQCVLGTLAGGQVAVTLTALRLYLGWSYVGNRLFSATVEYEETGWYDGEMWVKTPELLARDRLLASYKVKPVLNRLKITLIGLGLSLGASSLLLLFLPNTVPSPAAAPLFTPADALPLSRPSYDGKAARRYEPAAFQDELEDMEMAPMELLSAEVIPGCGPLPLEETDI